MLYLNQIFISNTINKFLQGNLEGRHTYDFPVIYR